MSKAKDYGHALYELAAETGIEKEIEKEFSEVASVFESNLEFINLLSNPRISISERLKIVDHVFGNRIQPYLLSLLKIFTEKRDISLIPICYKEYQSKYYEVNNILPVTVVSAVELNDNQKQRIIEKLEKSMNKTIVLYNKVDISCIGGIRLEYRGYMIDASIKNRFKKLEHNLLNADYS